jgi:sensor domain CHASE-containing protein
LGRARKIIRIYGDTIENLAIDWAYWDDAWLYAQGKNDDFYDENFIDCYLGTIGFDFVIVLDRDGNTVFEEAYSDDLGTTHPIASILPSRNSAVNALRKTKSRGGHFIKGFISTTKGPALVTSSEIYRSNASGLSVGLAVFPNDSDTVDVLLHNADMAMYETKRSGKNVWVKYHN